MTPPSTDADDKALLPILGTIKLASSLIDHTPGQLIFLVAAEAALLTSAEKLVDGLAGSAIVSWQGREIHFVVDQMIYAIMTGAIVVVAQAASERRHCGMREAFQASAGQFLSMLLVCVAIGIFSALTFPFSHLVGLVAELFFAVATPACMIERLGPRASLARSVALTRGHRGQVFGLFLVGGGVGLAVLAVGSLFYFGLDLAEPSWLHAALVVLAFLLAIPAVLLAVAVVVIAALVPTALYLNLRAIEDGRAPTVDAGAARVASS